jgi:hypothetical protein
VISACPDCAAHSTGGHLRHDDTCPLGNGIDALNADDRHWFEQHPD